MLGVVIILTFDTLVCIGMTMNPPLSRVVFRSPKCKEDVRSEEEGGRRLLATDDIAPESLILLEHCVSLPVSLLHMAIKHDDAVFDLLCPRDDPKTNDPGDADVDRESKQRSESARAKINANAIGDPDDLMSIGLAFSAINHSFPANSLKRTLRISSVPSPNDMAIIFVYVVAKRPIMAGEEITISYNNNARPDHPFIKCASDELMTQESQLEEKILSETKLQFRAIDQYLKKGDWIQVSCRHSLMVHGAFMGNSHLVLTNECMESTTPEFRAYLKELMATSQMKEPSEIECVFHWLWAKTMKEFTEFKFK